MLGGALRQGGGVVRIDCTERNQVIIEGNIGERRETGWKEREKRRTGKKKERERRQEKEEQSTKEKKGGSEGKGNVC